MGGKPVLVARELLTFDAEVTRDLRIRFLGVTEFTQAVAECLRGVRFVFDTQNQTPFAISAQVPLLDSRKSRRCAVISLCAARHPIIFNVLAHNA